MCCSVVDYCLHVGLCPLCEAADDGYECGACLCESVFHFGGYNGVDCA